MKNLILIYIIITLTACNTPSTTDDNAIETNIESETAAADIIKKIEEKPPVKKEDSKIIQPYGKLLYSMDELFIYKNKAAFKGTGLYDGDAELAELIKEEETEECPVGYLFTYNPLSLVGTYYSYESFEGGTLACGPPGSSQSVETISLETLESATLTDVFKEASILDALKKDTWVIGKAEEYSVDLNEIKSFDDFLEKLLGEAGNLSASSFAVLDFNQKTNLAAVRLIGQSYMGFNHSQYLQIGLWLEPVDEKIFREESRFYLDRFENGLFN